MYLARQLHGNGLSESRSAVDNDVVVVENKQRLVSQQSQSQPQPQPQPQLQPQSQQQPQPTTSLTNTRDQKTDPMRQHPSAWKLRGDDDNDDDDDGDDDDENEEEQPGDNV